MELRAARESQGLEAEIPVSHIVIFQLGSGPIEPSERNPSTENLIAK
jgi:hypothetical protein